jgi:hypothetical protein
MAMVAESGPSPLSMISRIGARINDAEDLRLQKSLLVAGSLMFITAAAVWGIIYLLIGEVLAGWIPLFYAFVSLASCWQSAPATEHQRRMLFIFFHFRQAMVA